MTLKRIILWSASLLLAANCLTGCLAGKFMTNYALKPAQHGEADIERTRAKADSLAPGVMAWYDDLHQKGIFKDINRTDPDGYKLHAVYAPAKDPATAQGTAIIVHGYTDNHLVFMYLVRMYRDEFNYNVMVPDLQFFGYSEGVAAQMGWLDRLDVEDWAAVAHDIFKDDFTVVHGVSMGAATAMMMSGDDLPPYIRAFVEDCGYSSAWDQFAHNLKDSFHLPPFPILNSASLVSKRRYGWGFKQASSVEQLAKCDRRELLREGPGELHLAGEVLPRSREERRNQIRDQAFRCRTASKRRMAAETETLRLSRRPSIGMRMCASAARRQTSVRPVDSVPITRAVPPVISVS